eukprot:GEMP01029849.1.p1 GENE.GEMP01029849.1~~GEMP01029849.1.p1  ORF type:complete len:394 (+),score=69.46 GEMP01029849.1:223-1404(+)
MAATGRARRNFADYTKTEPVLVDPKKENYFDVPSHYQFIKKVGTGAYGAVASFRDASSNPPQEVAVKKISKCFDDLIDAKRIYREIRLLRTFDHENIIKLIEMFPMSGVDYEDVYIVTDLMETDLHRVIYSKQPLTEDHHQYFTYQLLRGVKYLHSAGVIHRDLKPSNLLVNKNCDLKICDFGLARGVQGEDEVSNLTDYVVTRWYRAPEVVLMASEYSNKIDVWSIGCILAEMIHRRAHFMGKDHLDQIKKIIGALGMPSEAKLKPWLSEGPARRFLAKCHGGEGTSFKEQFPRSKPETIEALERMIEFNPPDRATVEEVLRLPYFEGLHNEADEPVAPQVVDWKFDDFQPTRRLLLNYLYMESSLFHPDMLNRDRDDLERAGIDELVNTYA